MDEMYLIWSNLEGSWWRPNARGFAKLIKDAGRYTREEAIRCCRARGCVEGWGPRELPVREADALRLVWSPELAK